MRDEKSFLWDMLDSARHVASYVAGKSFESFSADEVLQDAVIRRLSIIGEAAKKIPESTRTMLPALPFDAMSRMRDLMTHVYWGVKLEIVWDTATRDIPVLIRAFEGLPPEKKP